MGFFGFFNKINKNQNKSQTSVAQPSIQSPQPQNNQPLIENLIECSRRISPLTGELLKIISLIAILFSGLGFLDLFFYIQKIDISFPQSLLNSQNLIALIMVTVFIIFLVLILAFFISMVIYLTLDDQSFKNIFYKIFIALFYSLVLILFSCFLYIGGKGKIYVFLLVVGIYIIFLILYIYLNFKKNKSKQENKSIKGKNENSKILSVPIFALILTFVVLYLIVFLRNNNVNYFLIILSAIYLLFALLPINFYLYKDFDESVYNKTKNVLLFIFILAFMFFVMYFIISKPSLPFKELHIGGKIPIKLLISEKYFNELNVKNKVSKNIKSTKKPHLLKHNISCCSKKTNLEWHSFELLLKTPDSYYVEYKNRKKFLIPLKYIHSEEIITSGHKNKSQTTKNDKNKKNNNYNKSNKRLTIMQDQNPWFFNILSWISVIIASMIGGLITGLFMIWQNKRNYKNNLALNELEELKNEKAVLQALETEIKMICLRYTKYIKPGINKLLESDYQNRFKNLNNYIDDVKYVYNLLYFKISISQDYFTIYTTNGSFVGKIKNERLRKKIVSVYINIKGFIELIFLINNEKEKLEKLLEKSLINTQIDPNLIITHEKALSILIYQIKRIKEEQDNLSKQINKLLSLFKKEIKNIDKETIHKTSKQAF